MDLVYNLIVILHFIGLASLIGGFLVQIKSSPREVNNAMFHGALTQLVTGLLLVGLAYPMGNGDSIDNAKIAVKLVILLIITALVLVNRKKPEISTGIWGAIGGLAIANVAIAVLWN